MRETTLLPCPFCGGRGEVKRANGQALYFMDKSKAPAGAVLIRETIMPNGKTRFEYCRFAYVAQCVNKGCIGRAYRHFDTEAAAREAWNTRAGAILSVDLAGAHSQIVRGIDLVDEDGDPI